MVSSEIQLPKIGLHLLKKMFHCRILLAVRGYGHKEAKASSDFLFL